MKNKLDQTTNNIREYLNAIEDEIIFVEEAICSTNAKEELTQKLKELKELRYEGEKKLTFLIDELKRNL
jgi:Mg2+ and Co2+ transporter CorA